ncbi:beta-galactosidase [Rubellicoccus peritrichatus]|uniref:Beta-galactosidase n=1 Tax=Rubellicoccus peritrichatus TaxID=3080537 RepID=A0AAQ3QU96_9BACT|nr:beta-galactosidase [Puniceicoccus sp. CR14]WOO39750.1 beta-galactosidase [Puniceicoccus sp. CR14]
MNKLYLASAWYPEQFPKETWSEDLRTMKQLGLNTVRVGEFAWSCLEPSEGLYETDWLVEAMDLLAEYEIDCVLCTPTATPPLWLLQRYPEIGYVEPDGYRHKHGARQHASYNSPIFRSYASKITDVVARQFGNHRALLAWQIDNELGSHQRRCFSEDSAKKWHVWLKQRYGTIEALNEAWRTVIWSQRYSSFEDVPQPYDLCYYSHNFAVTLNYRRFMADAIAEFQHEQASIVREYSKAPITHNSTARTDDWRLSRTLDFPSSDLYTSNQTPTSIHFRFDSMRNILPGKPFWTMETSCEGFIDGELFKEGWIGCFSFLNYVMGGNGLGYWPWKQQPGGSEIINNSIVYSNGQPATGWQNVEESVEVKKQLEPVLEKYRPLKAEVVCVRSEVNGTYFFEDKAGGLEPNYNYRKRVGEYYQTLLDLGVWRDVVFDEAPIPECSVLISPYLPYISEGFIEQALTMVEKGTVWIAGPYTGFRTKDHAVHTDYLLGKLEERIGFKTRYVLQAAELDVDIGGIKGRTNQFATMFRPDSTDEVLGVYTTKRFEGAAWGIRRRYGKGTIYLPGTDLDELSRNVFLRSIFERENIRCYPTDEKVTVVPLASESGQEAMAFCNWGQETKELPVAIDRVLVASRQLDCYEGRLTLEPGSWLVAEVSLDAHVANPMVATT